MTVAFIDEHRKVYGVEPICEVLQFAPSTYYDAKNRQPCARAVSDAALKTVIRQLWADNYEVYGYRKMWHALRREGHTVGRAGCSG